ncbi:MAG: UvrD-helicase domain-containing protein, partial [Steroidobacteraceae bacterium]|nr:UvrD-helicase domain-containing protein [Steroidobacteraceae bacterium]
MGLDCARNARLDAAIAPGSALLQAPAGSGKTTILVQRLLYLLTQVAQPEEILALTFTRKAAAQMRARVTAALAQASAAESASEELPANEQITRALARDALRHAQRHGWDLLNNPNRLRIQTIDAFYQWLAARVPGRSEFVLPERIELRPQWLYRRAAYAALAHALAAAPLQPHALRLLRRLDNSWERAEELLADLLARRHLWLPHLLGAGDDELCRRIERGLANIAGETLRRAADLLGPQRLEVGRGLLAALARCGLAPAAPPVR